MNPACARWACLPVCCCVAVCVRVCPFSPLACCQNTVPALRDLCVLPTHLVRGAPPPPGRCPATVSRRRKGSPRGPCAHQQHGTHRPKSVQKHQVIEPVAGVAATETAVVCCPRPLLTVHPRTCSPRFTPLRMGRRTTCWCVHPQELVKPTSQCACFSLFVCSKSTCALVAHSNSPPVFRFVFPHVFVFVLSSLPGSPSSVKCRTTTCTACCKRKGSRLCTWRQ